MLWHYAVHVLNIGELLETYCLTMNRVPQIYTHGKQSIGKNKSEKPFNFKNMIHTIDFKNLNM